MQFQLLEQLFKTANPTGSITRYNNKYAVSFRANGQPYHYSTSTVIAMATHLDLVPELDIVSEARRIIDELKNIGTSLGIAAASDTVRHLWNEEGRIITLFVKWQQDEFDRSIKILQYTISHKSNPWVWTPTVSRNDRL